MEKRQDKFSGHGGDFEVDPVTRERRRVGEAPKSEPAGGGARDKDGAPIKEKLDKCQPALPEPGRAPWDAEPAAAGEAKKTTKGA